MKKFNSFTLLYLKWGSPIILLATYLYYFHKSEQGILIDILGIGSVIWIFAALYMMTAICFQNDIRNKFVTQLADIKETDEREVIITGQASKKTFVLNCGLLIFLLFLSIFRVQLYKDKVEPPDGKNHGALLFSLNFELLKKENLVFNLTSILKKEPESINENPIVEKLPNNENTDNTTNEEFNYEKNKIYIINYKGLPLAHDGLLILIILIQISSFYYYSRKEYSAS